MAEPHYIADLRRFLGLVNHAPYEVIPFENP